MEKVTIFNISQDLVFIGTDKPRLCHHLIIYWSFGVTQHYSGITIGSVLCKLTKGSIWGSGYGTRVEYVLGNSLPSSIISPAWLVSPFKDALQLVVDPDKSSNVIPGYLLELNLLRVI